MFTGLADFLKSEHNLEAESFLSTENSDQAFIADKSGFALSGSSAKISKAIATKGSKNVHGVNTDSKEQISVLCTINAAGEIL